MTLKRKMRFYKKLSIVVLFSMVFQIVTPTVSWALTSGPTQPEFTSFEPVVTNNMVDPFTGDFTYNLPVLNIPGANGGGYALSLSYHSGNGAEHESSWVGHGWTLNPGAINRGKQGFPDDWENEDVTYWNKSKPSVTVAYGVKGGLEIFSGASLGGSLGVSYNNYKGWGYMAGAGLELAHGCINLGYNVSDGEGSFSLSISPVHNYTDNKDKTNLNRKSKKQDEKLASADCSSEPRIQKRKDNTDKAIKAKNMGSFNASSYGLYSRPTTYNADNSLAFTGFNFDISIGAAVAPIPVPVFGDLGWFVRLSSQWAKGTEDGKFDRKVSGYMYPNSSNLMDYHTERLDGDLKRKDRYLGIPFNNADSYAVTGEGISGGFRLYQNQIGDFKPNNTQSLIINLGGEIEGETGVTNGFGWSVGAGVQTIDQGSWGALASFSPSDRNNRFFRFANDLGGNVLYANNQLQKATLENTSIISGILPNTSDISKEIAHNYAATKRNAASSFIAYNSNTEINQNKAGIRYKAYGKGNYIKGTNISRSNNNQVGEFSITNESGMSYTYALPTYSKNEKDLNIEVKKGDVDFSTNRAHKQVFSSEGEIDTNLKTIQGEERNSAYATSYLLTSITTSDYVDRTNNGPTDDDFGGYTKFVYERPMDNYKWRSPYTGFDVNKNLLYTTDDDMGFASMGEKEIYLLDFIETKTHVAIFYKSPRKDAYEAANIDASDRNKNIRGSRTLKKLDSITLYFKKDVTIDKTTNNYTISSGAKPLKIVNFSYDYSLVKNVPNNPHFTYGSTNPHPESGKLTLKKVWFDYEGTYEAKISPYEFVYNYPDITDYPSKYKLGGDDEITLPTNSTDENPPYIENASDPWGGYRPEGSQRHINMEPWLDQSKTEEDFDPAAWQLKQIKLPSGGEIHIQYEQDDYSYVQDKLAHVMARLAGPIKQTGRDVVINNTTYNNSKVFFVDEESIDLEKSDLNDLAAELRKIYIEDNDKIYWRFLYSLESESPANIGDCDGEFITGYANVKDVGVVSYGGEDRVYVRIGGDGDSDVDVPVKVCRDFRQANTLAIRKDCSGGSLFSELETGATPSPEEAFQIARKFFNEAKNFALALDRNCKVINPEHSFLRVPIVKHAKAKRGGGLRVKRLLMYDNTLGKPELYGSEYIYKTLDDEDRVISSGVASNEPAAMRQENALVTYLPRKNFGVDGAIRSIFAGRDKDQFEGPLGESMLPSPSVGYSKVIIRNIHSGETNTGFNVHEFYTYKDAPFKAEASELIPDSTTKEDYLPIYTGVFNYVKRYMYAVQGYLFKSYNFNGRPKKVATYSGSYKLDEMLQPDHRSLVSSQEFEYFGMKNSSVDDNDMALPVMTDLQTIGRKPLGVEVDLAMESRSVEENYYNASVSFDVSVGLLGISIIPYATFFPTATRMEGGLKTHVTSKVINYPAVVKRTTSYQDGIYHLTENVAFNERSGQPIVTRTWDSYNNFDEAIASNLNVNGNQHNGAYTQYNMPAHWTYPNFEQKASNERYLANNIGGTLKYNASTNPKYTLEFPVACGQDLAYTTGDLIQLNGNHLFNIYTIDIVGSTAKLGLLSTYYDSGPQAQIGVSTLEVIRSGRNNLVNDVISSFTTYGETGIAGCSNCPNYEQILLSDIDNKFNGKYNQRVTFANQINDLIQEANSTGEYQELKIPSNTFKGIEIGNYFLLIFPGGNLQIVKRGPNLVKNSNFDSYTKIRDGDNRLRYSECYDSNGERITDYIVHNWEPPWGNSPYTPGRIDPGTQGNENGLTNSDAMWQYVELVQGENYILKIKAKNNGYGYIQLMAPKQYSFLQVNNSNRCNQFGSAVLDIIPFSASDANVQHIVAIENEDTRYNKRYPFNYHKFSTGAYLTIYPIPKISEGKCCANFEIDEIEIYQEELLCSFQTSSVSISHLSGELIADNRDQCCLYYIEDISLFSRISNVVSASASNLGDNWGYDRAAYDVSLSSSERGLPFNLYELAQKGKWRTESTYAYRVPQEKRLLNPYNPNTLAYDEYNLSTGTFTMDLFSWDDPDGTKNDQKKWLRMNRILQTSPNGNALEEENVIGIKSSAKFGYDKSVPYLVAQNAPNGTVVFESFEREYGTGIFEDNVYIPSSVRDHVKVNSANSHSGSKSILSEKDKDFVETNIFVNQQIKNNGYQIKLWAKEGNGNLTATLGNVEISFAEVSRSGEWRLYAASFSPSDIQNLTVNRTHIVKLRNYGPNVYIDDVRMQPIDAEMVCYVYDTKTLRLVASFDDQHFGLYYQYDAEGKLVRKLIETERGIKTISETQYNTKVQQRP